MEEFLTPKEAQDVLRRVNEQLLKYPCLRFGQSLYNEMTVEESYDLLYKLVKD